jgi:pimeloyl-ACP methyl ester carboxylesterase
MFLHHPYTFLAAFLRRSFLRLYRNPRVRRSLLYHADTTEAVIAEAPNSLVEESWTAGNEMNYVLADATKVQCRVTVLGATEDFMVSAASVQATARAYGVEPIFLTGAGHMLQSEISACRLAALLQPFLSPASRT